MIIIFNMFDSDLRIFKIFKEIHSLNHRLKVYSFYQYFWSKIEEFDMWKKNQKTKLLKPNFWVGR